MNLSLFYLILIIQRPELSFRIEKEYFESKFEGQETDYTLNGDFYERTISEEAKAKVASP